jgi:NADH-quinone oxidoreductase subunit F
VDIETNARLGRDFSLRDLRNQGYEAIFLGIGAPLGTKLGIPGEEANGVVDALRFLREYNIRGSAPIGKRVVVIGGGNAAIDAARTAMRLGAESVKILYRRTRAEMPAYAEEIDEAEHEGVQIAVLVAPLEIVARDGRVAGVKCRHMVLGEFDRSGRRRPVGATEDDFLVEADQVIAAIGQTLNTGEFSDGLELKLNRAGFIAADPVSRQTALPWLFAGGDAVVGPWSVVGAIADGEKAAVGIDTMFNGRCKAFWRSEKAADTHFDPDADPVQYPRAKVQMIPVNKRRNNFQEVELPWSEAVARREAHRCLRCDYRQPVEKA